MTTFKNFSKPMTSGFHRIAGIALGVLLIISLGAPPDAAAQRFKPGDRTIAEIAVTNGNANLEKIGIDDLFDGHINAAMAGAAKPHRPIFDAAVKAGGASAATSAVEASGSFRSTRPCR